MKKRVAIPFEVGQVSTSRRKSLFKTQKQVAIPFEVGQVSTRKDEQRKGNLHRRNPF